jgi:hypothetical protein
MIARHNCTRCLVWPKHHGRQKSTIVFPRVEYGVLPNSRRSSVVTNSMIVRKTPHDELFALLCAVPKSCRDDYFDGGIGSLRHQFRRSPDFDRPQRKIARNNPHKAFHRTVQIKMIARKHSNE